MEPINPESVQLAPPPLILASSNICSQRSSSDSVWLGRRLLYRAMNAHLSRSRGRASRSIWAIVGHHQANLLALCGFIARSLIIHPLVGRPMLSMLISWPLAQQTCLLRAHQDKRFYLLPGSKLRPQFARLGSKKMLQSDNKANTSLATTKPTKYSSAWSAFQ